MPRREIDYSKTVIYKIVCKDLNVKDIYVGHTTDFIRRKNEHKRTCNNETSKSYNYKIYKSIRNNGGWDNFEMIEVEKFPCKDSNEAKTRERYYYELLQGNLNKNIPILTIEEKANYGKNYFKNYYIDKKEKIQERKRKKFTCECGSISTIDRKAKHNKSKKHLRYLETLNK
jgi:hypothetical protein